MGRVLVDYTVPLKDRTTLTLKAVNWPKWFYMHGVRPVQSGEKERAKCLKLLAAHSVPKGAERKHFNTVAFFDHCVDLWRKERKKRGSGSAG